MTAVTADDMTIIMIFDADNIDRDLNDLSELLHSSVHAGASIGFVLPFSVAESEAFWRDSVRPAVRAGGLLLLAARWQGKVIGSVQLNHDTPANQPHRADVKKLLVHPNFRRQGIARALMAELEGHARRLGRYLLTLDTRTGDEAEPLYTSLGYKTVGAIPGFCIDAIDQRRIDPTTIMYKQLGDDLEKEKSSEM